MNNEKNIHIFRYSFFLASLACFQAWGEAPENPPLKIIFDGTSFLISPDDEIDLKHTLNLQKSIFAGEQMAHLAPVDLRKPTRFTLTSSGSFLFSYGPNEYFLKAPVNSPVSKAWLWLPDDSAFPAASAQKSACAEPGKLVWTNKLKQNPQLRCLLDSRSLRQHFDVANNPISGTGRWRCSY